MRIACAMLVLGMLGLSPAEAQQFGGGQRGEEGCRTCKAQCDACGFGASCYANCDRGGNPIVSPRSPCGKGVQFYFCKR